MQDIRAMEFVHTDQNCQTQLVFAALYKYEETTISNIHSYINNTLNVPFNLSIIISTIKHSLRARTIFCERELAKRILYDQNWINIYEDLFYREKIPYKVFACDSKKCSKKCEYAHTYNEKTLAMFLVGPVYPEILRSDDRFVGNYMERSIELLNNPPGIPNSLYGISHETTCTTVPPNPTSQYITEKESVKKLTEEAEQNAKFYKLKLENHNRLINLEQENKQLKETNSQLTFTLSQLKETNSQLTFTLSQYKETYSALTRELTDIIQFKPDEARITTYKKYITSDDAVKKKKPYKANILVKILLERVEIYQIESKQLSEYKCELELSQRKLKKCQQAEAQLSVNLDKLHCRLDDYNVLKKGLLHATNNVNMLMIERSDVTKNHQSTIDSITKDHQSAIDSITKKYRSSVVECVKLGIEVQTLYNQLT